MKRRSFAYVMGVLLAVGTWAPVAAWSAPIGDPTGADPLAITCSEANVKIVLLEHNPILTGKGIYPYGDGSGYRFMVTQVMDIDLTNPQQWAAVSSLDPDAARLRTLSDIPVVRVTGVDKNSILPGPSHRCLPGGSGASQP